MKILLSPEIKLSHEHYEILRSMAKINETTKTIIMTEIITRYLNWIKKINIRKNNYEDI